MSRSVRSQNGPLDPNQLPLHAFGLLTQVFQQVEGLPLYRYQLQLRLVRALDLLGEYLDLTVLALDLGFSSYSHFSSAFKQVYGQTPLELQRSARVR